MAIILFDNNSRSVLYPFTYTKAVADLRFGILSVKERWEMIAAQPVFVVTEKYLQPLYSLPETGTHTWIDASVMITGELIDIVLSLQPGYCIADEKGLIAGCTADELNTADNSTLLSSFTEISDHTARRLEHPWQLMQWNDEMIRYDMHLVTNGRASQSIPQSVNTVAAENIFIEEGAKLSFCNLNAANGPIYIGRDAEIMEGTSIRGPFVLGNNSVVKMNSHIYGATTLGPFCMGGGEIKNSVIMGYSNKAHEGYLGDSVVGEWCNFGAGSTNSNVKNTAGEIKIWDLASKEYVPIGNKCGVIMGDYSRIAVNSAINTGSMIGVSCNVFGEGLLPTVIDNFNWGQQGEGSYEFDKAMIAIRNWKKMKQQVLTKEQTAVLAYIFVKNKHENF